MRHSLTVAALATAVILSGCGGGEDEPSTAPPGATTPASSGEESTDRERALLIATQGYVDSLLKGDTGGVLGYLDPTVCDDDDEGTLAFAVNAWSKTADGATMKIKNVKLYGTDRGGAGDYELSGASDAFRRLVKSSLAESKAGSWVYRGDEWYLSGPCEGETVSPSPATAVEAS